MARLLRRYHGRTGARRSLCASPAPTIGPRAATTCGGNGSSGPSDIDVEARKIVYRWLPPKRGWCLMPTSRRSTLFDDVSAGSYESTCTSGNCGPDCARKPYRHSRALGCCCLSHWGERNAGWCSQRRQHESSSIWRGARLGRPRPRIVPPSMQIPKGDEGACASPALFPFRSLEL